MINRVVVTNNPLAVKETNYTWQNKDGAVYFNISAESLLDFDKITVTIVFNLW